MPRIRVVYTVPFRERVACIYAGVWLKVARFAFRRLGVVHWTEPDGLPLRRSADDPCAGYSPRRVLGGDWLGCQGDSHYFRRECAHFGGGEEEDG